MDRSWKIIARLDGRNQRRLCGCGEFLKDAAEAGKFLFPVFTPAF